MKRMNMEEVMNSKAYTMIIGAAPMGAVVYRHNVTGEEVLVVLNEEVFNMAQQAQATVNSNTMNKEEENMANNTVVEATVVEEKKEEKKMSIKERMATAYNNTVKKVDWEKGVNRTGFGIGYGTRTVTNEAKYAASKVKDAICGTKAVKAFSNGYYEGQAQADYDFAMRCADRAEKARERADAKAAAQAAQEMVEELF